MATQKSSLKVQAVAGVRRSGKPFTVYLADDLNRVLNQVSEQRNVDKSVIVRVALKRLFTELESGQLELPLGI